ncbi:MAG: LAGLIDADG family homing endonuclease [Candidatus Woesearchaeota archaeon]
MIDVNKDTLIFEFKKNAYHPFHRILRIIKDINISDNELFDNIIGFYHRGSHREFVKIPRFLEAGESFVEGYALYLAEGDNGWNGFTRPRKFRFTNSEISVIDHMINWLNKYFPGINKYLVVIKPLNHKGDIITEHKIPFKITEDKYNKIVKYRLCADNAILIDLFLSLEKTIKELCSRDHDLARAYIRGMMIGEGTVYSNRMRYVRIEMRNGKEIGYIHRLLVMLGFDCKISYRTTRENMWSIYIGTGQLRKFYNEIGFGVHEKRQKKLREAISLSSS